MFHLGQLVVCIDDGWVFPRLMHLHPKGAPRAGGIYEIDRVQRNEDRVFLGLAEFPEFIIDRVWPSWPLYNACHFRPVQHNRIAAFTALLKPANRFRKAHEDA